MLILYHTVFSALDIPPAAGGSLELYLLLYGSFLAWDSATIWWIAISSKFHGEKGHWTHENPDNDTAFQVIQS